jgi:hypothetical protein
MSIHLLGPFKFKTLNLNIWVFINKTSLSILPSDIIKLITLNLKIEHILRLRRISTKYNTIFSSNKYWEILLVRDFDVKYTGNNAYLEYKSLYIKQIKIKKEEYWRRRYASGVTGPTGAIGPTGPNVIQEHPIICISAIILVISILYFK